SEWSFELGRSAWRSFEASRGGAGRKMEKRRIVAETVAPGETVHGVARRYELNASMLYMWRKRYRDDLGLPAPVPRASFAAVRIAAGADLAPASGLIEVELPTGVRLRVSGAADRALGRTEMRRGMDGLLLEVQDFA